MASIAQDSFFDDVMRGNVSPEDDTIYCMLLAATYTPNKGGHTKRSDVVAHEIAATGGYVTGGVASATSVTKDTTNHRVDVVCGLANFGSTTTITAAYAAYYKRRGGAANADELIGINDFGGNIVSSNAPFQVGATTFRIQN